MKLNTLFLTVFLVVIMKNFNRRDSHGHHGSKRRELAQHAHSLGSQAFTYTFASRQLQARGASVHAGSFRVSVIHETLTWTTGSLSCVRDHSCACVYTRELGIAYRQRVSTTFLTRKIHNFFLCSWRGSNLWIRVRRSTN